MPILAGQKITAARLNWKSGGSTLTDANTLTAAAGYEQWGGETVVFPNPGVPVFVSASASGRLFNNTDVDSTASVRVGISLDGGSNFTYGNAPQINVGSGGATRNAVAVQNHLSGTPTGDIVVRVEVDVDDSDVDARSGYLTATMIPQ